MYFFLVYLLTCMVYEHVRYAVSFVSLASGKAGKVGLNSKVVLFHPGVFQSSDFLGDEWVMYFEDITLRSAGGDHHG